MNNHFSKHLFKKLGLFISLSAITLGNIRLSAAMWPTESQQSLGQILDDPDKPFYTDADEFNLDLTPPSSHMKGSSSPWDMPQNSFHDVAEVDPQVLFSIDQPTTSHHVPDHTTSLHEQASVSPYDNYQRISLDIEKLLADEREHPFEYPVESPEQKNSLPEIKTSATKQVAPAPLQRPSVKTPSLSLDPVTEAMIEQELQNIKNEAASSKQKSERLYHAIPAQPMIPRPVAQAEPAEPTAAPANGKPAATAPAEVEGTPKTILINFNNVNIIEYIRFISRISNKNFIFDEADLQFNVTIVSEEPTSIENIMTALIQELRIHDLTLIEQGNNLIIHKNPKVNSISKVISDDITEQNINNAEIVTQVFRLNTLEPERAAAIIRPLVSSNALIEFIKSTNHIIITDVVTNVQQIGKLLKSIDAPNNGLVIGQYVARTADIDVLMPLVQRIMAPISRDQSLSFVPYENGNSIFVVSTPFLVERSLSILQHLDQEKGKTRIIDLSQLKFEQQGKGGTQGAPVGPTAPVAPPAPPKVIPTYEGGWEYGPNRLDYLEKQAAEKVEKGEKPHEGLTIYPMFIPVEIPVKVEVPKAPPLTREEEEARARALQAPPPPTHVGVIGFRPEEQMIPVEKITRRISEKEEFVPKPVSKSKFFIHRLQYRTGDAILNEIQQVAASLSNSKGHDELLATINTAVWLQDAKAIVYTGTPENIEKVKELIEQIDIPRRQVFIDMLMLSTSVDDSLNYAVNYANRFGGGNQAGSQGFQTTASPLQGVMDSTGVNSLGNTFPNPPTSPIPFNNALVPDPINLAKPTGPGFSLGVIGQHIIHKGLGLEFNSIGALVTALHERHVVKIIMNPKIFTEDNVPAYVFVGINTPFQTQSIANQFGTLVTNNVTFQDVGSSLQVTPHIQNSDMITLDILQEYSAVGTAPTGSGATSNVIGPTTNKTTTKTTVHVPNGFFVIISGQMQDQIDHDRQQVPCLGSAPIIGACFSSKTNSDQKRNLMIFIRPQIIDTDEEFQNLTRHNQDIWEFRNELPKMWLQETEEALDWANIRRTQNTDDEDDPECCQFAH